MTTIINASTSSGLVQTADTSGTLVLQSNGTTQQTIDSTGSYGQLKSGTAVASTSGTSIDFTSIPSWVKRITVMMSGVSSNSTSIIQIQLGTGGVAETSGYSGMVGNIFNTNNTTRGLTATTGFQTFYNNSTAATYSGSICFTLLGSNTWTCSGMVYNPDSAAMSTITGVKTLAGTLNMVRITTVNGTDTFDAGSINILYEG